MDLRVSLGQRQEQRLLLLPKMLQAIEILQLSTQDLVAMIDQELSQNETLELGPTQDSPVTEPPAEPTYEDIDDYGGPSLRRVKEDDRPDFFSQVPSHNVSLHGHLLGQLSMLELAPGVREILSFLIGSLDRNGHLPLTEDELGTFFAVPENIAEALRVLRLMDPAGVGQPGPRESMLAQLDPGDPDHDALTHLIEDHLEDLAKNRVPAVARALGVPIEQLKTLTAKLRALEPCPGRAFETQEPTSMRPDVVVRREDGEWQVYVDDARVPPLTISSDYEHLARDRRQPRQVRDYLRKKLGSARDLLLAIEQRRQTLGRVARAAVDRQHGFLERGVPGLRPLKMQEVADAVGVHLSTVSRAISDKYLQTDFGVFALRILFDGGNAVGTDDQGKGGASRHSVKERIRRLVAAEDPSDPLSDEQIVQRLTEEGLPIARRTVAKYRRELKIPSSWRRREY